MLGTRRQKLAALGCGVALVGGVIAYRSDALGKLRSRYATATRLLRLYAQAGTTGGELACTLLSDLQTYIASDADALPPSLVQLGKVFSSPEATACSTAFITALLSSVAVTTTATASSSTSTPREGEGGRVETVSPGVADRFLALLFSERGEGLLSCAVGMAAKSSVGAVCSFMEQHQTRRTAAEEDDGSANKDDGVAQATRALLGVITHPEGRSALSAFIATFVATAVSTYVDATNDHNYYEDFVASVATPSNRAAVEHISAHVCREAIGAYFSFSSSQPPLSARLDSSPHDHDGDNNNGNGGFVEGGEVSKVLSYEEGGGARTAPRAGSRVEAKSRPSEGVVGQVFRAASTADGRRLVIELASSVTAEAVRTTVGSLAEVTGWRTATTRNGVKSSEVVGSTVEVSDEGTLCECLSSRTAALCLLFLAFTILLAMCMRWLNIGTTDLGIAEWQPPPGVTQP
jgi:hypothetical protein